MAKKKVTDENLEGPVAENQTVGKIVIRNGEQILSEHSITVAESVGKLNFFGALHKLLTSFSSHDKNK